MCLGMATNAYDLIECTNRSRVCDSLHTRLGPFALDLFWFEVLTGVQLSNTNHPSFKHWHFFLNAKKPVDQQLKQMAIAVDCRVFQTQNPGIRNNWKHLLLNVHTA